MTKTVLLIVPMICTLNAGTGEILPFPQPKSASKAGLTLKDSTHKWRQAENHLPKDAPNIIIFMTDDTGFSNTETFGGPIHTPTLNKLAEEGVKYNEFHTTAMCSPTRAAMLTGRNHHHVGYGQIAEFASDWDGYIGAIPKETATLPQILGAYGYTTSAFGKWHNTPTTDLTPTGPFDQWPTGLGFDYFYGFIAGETSQWEPALYENTRPVEIEHGKHLTNALTEKAIGFIRQVRMQSPDKPFFMWFTPGAVHGPHHVPKEYAAKYKGKFDAGWEALRKETFEKQKKMGIIPANTKLTEIDPTMTKWADIPEKERAFQTKLMENYAGFLQHTDEQYGLIVDELERLGIKDNTLIIYISGDNGSSAEGLNGSISELLAQNGMPSTVEQQMEVLEKDFGGLDALGGPKTEPMYHHGWAWAGSTPFKSTKLIAAHFGGTRNPLVISWPKSVKHDTKMHSQFHSVIDIAPTIYDILNITPPKFYNGVAQDRMDGKSMLYSFNDAKAKTTTDAQYFEIMGSRGIYKDGWFAGTIGPRLPWNPFLADLAHWDPAKDKWELYDLSKDFSQANNVADKFPVKLQEMKDTFIVEATKNKVFPIGAGLYTVAYHPEDVKASTLTEWNLYPGMSRLAESQSPKYQSGFSTHATIDVEVKENASGVLYAVGGVSAGFTVYMDKGYLHAEYNAMTLNRYKVKSDVKVPAGKHTLEVIVKAKEKKKMAPSTITLKIDGKVVGETVAERTVPAVFTASDTFDVAEDLLSPVALDYYDRAPFKFEGKINLLNIKYID